MSHLIRLSIGALLLLPCGCALTPSQQSTSPHAAGWEASIGKPGAVLYGRDGSPVGAAGLSGPETVAVAANPQPQVTATQDMPHRPEESMGSRPVLLQLYQETITEKENLQEQLEITQQALVSTEDRMLDLEKRLEDEIRAREAAETARQNSETQTFELGRRLSVAQMRRLEAEKLLLEKTLAERRQLAGSQN